MTEHDGMVELRQHIERKYADVIDGVAIARRLHRSDVVREIVREWVEKTVHEANVVVRMAEGKGIGTETERKASE